MRRALEGLPGVRKANVSFFKRSAVVTYAEGEVTVGEMVAALRRAGYEAKPL